MADGEGAATPRLAVSGLRSDLAGPFDFTLAAGECAAISGASGSGKSLFLRMIADLDPNQGTVRLDGVERSTLAAPEWRRRIPYVAAESGWWLDRAIDHFAPDRRAAAQALAAELGVGTAQLDMPVQRLSTGERQRLALVRGFVMQPLAILLDEPTGPLDPDSTRAVEAHIRRMLAGGAAVLMVSHDPSQPGRLGATHYRMADRKLSLVGDAPVEAASA
ncbi:ABC transporter ATP-binding protein [Caulobacter sp. KR2-114]|uniref:ABC transporter ATP-binding protein n=1 Tax=Caulobacter sp. KR2-114 TaxID=3400912 RepID=UPI003C06B353